LRAMDEWKPQKGDWVRFRVYRDTEIDPRVPRAGRGMIVRDLRGFRAESCDYEVSVDGHGDLCFYRAELRPWMP
jgi:hypothetical protein